MKKILLIGSAPYMPEWWEVNKNTYADWTLAAINNSWQVPFNSGRTPDLWMAPCDYFTTSPLAMQPSMRIQNDMIRISETQYNAKGVFKVNQVSGGTMLINSLLYLLNYCVAIHESCLIHIAGCDLQYFEPKSHFYVGGKPDPLRNGIAWIASALNRLSEDLKSWPDLIVLNAGWGDSVLPYPRVFDGCSQSQTKNKKT